MQLALHQLVFAWPSAIEPLFNGLTATFPAGWTGVVGENGCGKTTLLKLIAGTPGMPHGGTIRRTASALYCPQRTDDPPGDLQDFFDDFETRAFELRHTLELDDDMCGRWDTLSHGERKRIQIAHALWHAPGILALDEPTNHIDAGARGLLIRALRKFNGTGLLVSHDRGLLDTLCSQCLFITPPAAVMRPGGVTHGYQEDEKEQTAARHADDRAKHTLQRLRTEAQHRREKGEQLAGEARKKARTLKKDDHDSRAAMQLARLTGKDAFSGKLVKQLGSRISRAADERRHNKPRKTYASGVTLGDTSPSTRAALVDAPAADLPLRPGVVLRVPALRIAPTDRIALTGANGSGKSTLLRHLLGHLKIEPEHLVYVPQEIPAEEARGVLARIRALPGDARGRLMTTVSQLGSRPARLLESDQPSPGETRKLLLALGLLHHPHLVVMDEPTNHMDLPGIQCLEDVLGACRCGLLLVSHDHYFLDRLTVLPWHITTPATGINQLVH